MDGTPATVTAVALDIPARFDRVDQRFDVLDGRLDAMDQRFDAMDQRFDGIDRRLDGHDGRFDRLEAQIIVTAEETRRHFDVVAESLVSQIRPRFNRRLLALSARVPPKRRR